MFYRKKRRKKLELELNNLLEQLLIKIKVHKDAKDDDLFINVTMTLINHLGSDIINHEKRNDKLKSEDEVPWYEYIVARKFLNTYYNKYK